jgi:hypothetical protein
VHWWTFVVRFEGGENGENGRWQRWSQNRGGELEVGGELTSGAWLVVVERGEKCGACRASC